MSFQDSNASDSGTHSTKGGKRAARAKDSEEDKALESWLWDAACKIRGAKDAPKFKDYILPLAFTKRFCDVFDDEINRIAQEAGSRKKAFQLAKADHTASSGSAPLNPKARCRS